MDAALKLTTYPCLLHRSLCVRAPISSFHKLLFSYATSPCFPVVQMCVILFFLWFFFYHIFSFCSLPHSVNHLIFLLEICLGYHYSKSCYEGAVCLFLALINIIYQWWITAKKICLFCSTFLVSVSSSKYVECWLVLKVWNWPETLPVEYSYCSFTNHRNCVYIRVHI